jgi:hypothetical protein
VTTGTSRWLNFYVEGLRWLVENVGIDGLYLDDIAFDGTTMKRVRKVLLRGNPGALIDVHSANRSIRATAMPTAPIVTWSNCRSSTASGSENISITTRNPTLSFLIRPVSASPDNLGRADCGSQT